MVHLGSKTYSLISRPDLLGGVPLFAFIHFFISYNICVQNTFLDHYVIWSNNLKYIQYLINIPQYFEDMSRL